MILVDTQNDRHWESQSFEALRAGPVDGYLLFEVTAPEALGPDENVVMMETEEPGRPSVRFDGGGGSAAAFEHLVELGHRRIGHLAAAFRALTFQQREESRLRVLGEAGLDPDTQPRVLTPISIEDARENALVLLDEEPTAVFCDDDVIAAGMYLAARERGLRIPDDLSVVGFDDMDFARVLGPPLTTVALDAELLGATSFELLESAHVGQADAQADRAARRAADTRIHGAPRLECAAWRSTWWERAACSGRTSCGRRGGAAVALTRAELDVTDAAAVREALAGATVINCAAYTDVDGAESDRAAAHAVNEEGARNVAEAAGRVLYVSTDYVFDGAKGEPYVESDPTAPLQEYGRSKLAGERATADANPDHLVVRSSWLFGAGGEELRRDDAAAWRASATSCAWWTTRSAAPPSPGISPRRSLTLAAGDERGVLHVAGAGSCSWFEFARDDRRARRASTARCSPARTDEFPRPARRPAYSVLGSERGSPALPAWQDGLDAYLGVRA